MNVKSDNFDHFKKLGVFWQWDKNPSNPHAEIADGLHAISYFNCNPVRESPEMEYLFVGMLLKKLELQEGLIIKEKKGINMIVGTPIGGVTMSHSMALRVRLAGLQSVKVSYPKSEPFSAFTWKGAPPSSDDTVLVVDDVVSTCGTVNSLNPAILSTGAKLSPYLLVYVNQSGAKETLFGQKIIPLLEFEQKQYSPDDCPACKAGSQALKPKQNWRKLIRVPVKTGIPLST